jgi:hypothetical protein
MPRELADLFTKTNTWICPLMINATHLKRHITTPRLGFENKARGLVIDEPKEIYSKMYAL